jgi:hypothetical protein
VAIVAIVVDVVNEGDVVVLEEAEAEAEAVKEVVEARDWIQATPVPSHHFRVAITLRVMNWGCLGSWLR